jgi:hypothetical protein
MPKRMPRPLPVPEGDHEVVESFEIVPEEQSEGWQLAYERAIGKGCSEKGARLYAEAHAEDFEPKEAKEQTAEEIQAEIDRLTALKEQVASS